MGIKEKEKEKEKVQTRPKASIDWTIVDKFLEAGAKGTDIAAYFGIHPNTFYRRVEEQSGTSFSEYFHQKRAKGNSILAVVQYEVAVKDRNITMLIWLGKQRLEQKEPEAAVRDPENRCIFNSWAVEQAKSKEKLDPK